MTELNIESEPELEDRTQTFGFVACLIGFKLVCKIMTEISERVHHTVVTHSKKFSSPGKSIEKVCESVSETFKKFSIVTNSETEKGFRTFGNLFGSVFQGTEIF
jgi:hypothetical protein